MANALRVLHYAAKRPYEPVVGYNRNSHVEAEAKAAELRAEGWETRVTSVWHRRTKRRTWNVWKREAVKCL